MHEGTTRHGYKQTKMTANQIKDSVFHFWLVYIL